MKVESWKRDPEDPADPHREKLMRVANVPQRKWDASLDLASGPAAERVRDYVAALRENIERGDGLLLWGDYRAGKSCLAACVLREVAAHRARAFWIEASDLADCWTNRDAYFVSARSAHFLVVDDLGEEGDHNFRKEMITRALRFRLERGMATVVTTNMAPDQLKAHYGVKVHALLKEVLGKPIEVLPWRGDEAKAAKAAADAAKAEATKGRRLAAREAVAKARTEAELGRLRIKGDRSG